MNSMRIYCGKTQIVYIAAFIVGDVNGDRLDDLICVHSTGAVNVALASFTGSNKFMAQAWQDDDFGFCTYTNAKASSVFFS